MLSGLSRTISGLSEWWYGAEPTAPVLEEQNKEEPIKEEKVQAQEQQQEQQAAITETVPEVVSAEPKAPTLVINTEVTTAELMKKLSPSIKPISPAPDSPMSVSPSSPMPVSPMSVSTKSESPKSPTVSVTTMAAYYGNPGNFYHYQSSKKRPHTEVADTHTAENNDEQRVRLGSKR